jgi:hypothetical protein
LRRGELGQAEIKDLYAAVPREQNIVRFEVAVNYTGGVRGGQPAGDLHGDVQRLAQPEFYAA